MARQMVTARLNEDEIARLDRMAEAMALPGEEPNRSAALRVALLRGLDVMEAETKKPKRR